MTTISYSPISFSDCAVDYTDADDIKTEYNNWAENLNPAHATTDVGYVDAMNKCIALAGYIESQGYNTDKSHYTGFSGIQFGDIHKYTVKQQDKDFYDVYTYIINDTATTPNKLITLVLANNLDLTAYINHALDYDYDFRGNHYFTNNNAELPANTSALGDVYIGAGKDAIIALYLISHYNFPTTQTGCLINMPSIFKANTWNTSKYTFKKLTHYIIDNWNYKWPSTVKYNNTDEVLHPLAYETTDTHFNTQTMHLTDPLDCVNGYNSIYTLGKNINHGNVPEQCMTDLGIAMPNAAFTLPVAIADRDNARKAFYVLKYDLDTTLITNFASKYFDEENGIGAIKDSNNHVFIVVWDKFGAEETVTDQETTVSVTYSSLTYDLLKDCEVNYSANITAMVTDLSLDFTETYFIYSFGYGIHSLLKDLFTVGTTLNVANVTLYIEGLPGVTKNFTGFTPFTNTLINNIFQDMVLNHKVTFDNVLDDIQDANVYDVDNRTSPVTDQCLHSIYGYDKFLVGV